MYFLLASLGALALGPVAVRACKGRPGAWRGLDAFIFVSILGLVGVVLLPDILRHGGAIAAAIMVLGFLLPGWLENRFAQRADQAHSAALWLGLLGLMLHSWVDGMALGAPHIIGLEQGEELASAVLIHRLPVGMTIWWLLSTKPWRAVAVLGAVGGATVAGFVWGQGALVGVSPFGLAAFQALLAGSLLHVVVHRSSGFHPSEPARGFQFAGAVLAGLTLWWSAHDHDSGIADAFVHLAGVSAPALLVAFLGAGLLFTFLPSASVTWLRRGGRVAQAGRGVLFGLPLPVCSCGVLPLFHALVGRGAPSAAVFAFLVATPELGIDAILLSLPLLGGSFTIARVVAAALVALAVGVVMARVAAQAQVPSGEIPAAPGDRWGAIWRTGFVEVLDETGPWILFGLGAAALLATELDFSALTALPPTVQLPLFALLGLPVYVCASGATPLVAVLVAQGISPGAALVFLLTGPATNITTFGVVARLYSRSAALIFCAVVLGATLTLGFAVDQLAIDWGFPSLGGAAHQHLSAVEWVSLGALACLLAASLWRQGVRGFAAQVVSQSSEGDLGGHDHGEHDESCCAH